MCVSWTSFTVLCVRDCSLYEQREAQKQGDVCWDVLNFNKNCNEEFKAWAIFQFLIALSWISRGTLHFLHGQLIRSSLVPCVFAHLVCPMSHVPIKLLINVCLFLFFWVSHSLLLKPVLLNYVIKTYWRWAARLCWISCSDKSGGDFSYTQFIITSGIDLSGRQRWDAAPLRHHHCITWSSDDQSELHSYSALYCISHTGSGM